MTDKFFALYSCLLPVLRVNVSPLASEYIRLFSLLITRDVSQERRRETAVIQAISPFACDFHDGVTVLPFSRKHCTLTATLEMGKIYSNHLHFLSNLLKCPVGQHRKWHFRAPKFKNFWGSMPPDGDSPCFGAPSDF